ncbi:MAG: tetratricopeptide repeat protein [Bacillota bacterium]
MEQVRDIDPETDSVPAGSSGECGGDLDQEIDDNLCAICKVRERDYSVNSRSILCRECREKYSKLRIPLAVRLFLVAILVSFVVSVFRLPQVLANYRTYIDAGRNMQAKQYSSACTKYLSLLETYSDSIPIIIKASEAALSAQRFGDLAYVFDTYWVGCQLNDSEYAIAMEYSDFLDRYITTMDEIMAILSQLESEQPQENSPPSAVEPLHRELKALLERDDVDLSLVYYYLGRTSPDITEAVNYLRLATEQDSRVTFPCAYYGNALRRSGNLEEARDVYQKALQRNAEDADSMRGLSVVHLLDGDLESALITARKAYELEPTGLFIPETLIVMLHENGLHDEADALLDQITAQGFEADADFAEYLEGKVTARDYYTR